jgi:hypothetical protein
MYINLNDTMNYLRATYNGSQNNYILISEFIPYVTWNNTQVSQMTGRIAQYSIFENVCNTANTNNSISILSYMDWKTLLDAYIQEINVQTRLDVSCAVNINSMYNSYVELTRDLRVSGIANITISQITPTAVAPWVWYPIGTTYCPTDILTYASMLAKVFPKLMLSYGAVKQMHNMYINGLKSLGVSVGVQKPNSILAAQKHMIGAPKDGRGTSLGDITNAMNSVVNNTIRGENGQVTTYELRNIVETQGNINIDLTRYFQEMLHCCSIESRTAIEMLKYTSDLIDRSTLTDGAPDIVEYGAVLEATTDVAQNISSNSRII